MKKQNQAVVQLNIKLLTFEGYIFYNCANPTCAPILWKYWTVCYNLICYHRKRLENVIIITYFHCIDAL